MRKKYGLLIGAKNVELHNSQVQYANPHGCLHYSNLQEKVAYDHPELF